MYYPDLSCNVVDTFRKIESLEIAKTVPMDWMGLVIMNGEGKITIDGGVDYSNIGREAIVSLIAEKEDEIFNLEKAAKYRNFKTDIGYQPEMIAIYIRTAANYKVYFICCTLKKTYDKKDLVIIKVLLGIYYENVLLHNTIVQETNYLQSVFNSTESGIISIGLDGTVTTANKAAAEIFSVPCDQIIGDKKYSFLTRDEAKALVLEGVDFVVENNKNFFVKEALLIGKDSNKRAVNVSMMPLNSSKKKVVGVVLVISDITTEQVLEKEIEQIKQFASLGELAAGVAHDIKNPLMSIRGSARIVQKKLCKESNYIEYEEFIDPIISEVDRINEVIEQMLSYRIMTEESTYTLVNIAEVLDKCCNVINFHKESKYISIEKNYLNNLPLIKGNNVQLQQAFINILLNAVQAIKSEGTIRINCYVKEEKELVVAILDDGVGIDTHDLGEIFYPFYSTKENGTGYGLSIVKRAINEHQGDIFVKSTLNVGTTFVVTLPLPC